MFAPHDRSSDEELLMSHMKDFVQASGPTGTFGTITMLLAPYTDSPVCEAVSALAPWGDVEVKRPQTTKVRTTTVKQHKRKKNDTMAKMAPGVAVVRWPENEPQTGID